MLLTYSLSVDGDGSEASETMDFTIGNVPMPPVPNGSTPTPHWLQILNDDQQYATASGTGPFGYAIIPLQGFWQMDNGDTAGRTCKRARHQSVLPFQRRLFVAARTFMTSPGPYSGVGTYLHFVTIPTWDVFTPANGKTPASETIYVANYGAGLGFQH